LIDLVEASRHGTGAARRKFLLALTGSGEKLLHPGLPGGQASSSLDDVEALAESGLIRVSRPRPDTISFTLTPLAMTHYDTVKAVARQRVVHIESDVRRLLESTSFRRRYAVAYRNWAAAEALLWRDASQPPQIARFCREAIESLAASLVERFRPRGVAAMPEASVYRLKVVVEQQSGRLSPSRRILLDALVDYWAALTEVVEQSADKERQAEATTWEDARSLVLQTLVVLIEADRSLTG